MRLVIGLVGEQGGGKGTFTKLLQAAIGSTFSLEKIGSGDLLIETLNLWNIPTSRANLQKLVVAMNQTYGEGSVTRAVQKRIENCKSEIIIIDSIRLLTDLEMLRGFPDSLLVYIAATQEKRYQRIRARKEKVGEEFATFEQFQQEELAGTEIYISQIANKADFRINNDTTVADYQKQVEIFCTKLSK